MNLLIGVVRFECCNSYYFFLEADDVRLILICSGYRRLWLTNSWQKTPRILQRQCREVVLGQAVLCWFF